MGATNLLEPEGIPARLLDMDALASLGGLVIPDPWQIEAIRALRENNSVVVTAPTGAGKTLIFEKFWEHAQSTQRAIYTVPTRALANDKWREWGARGWRVGLLTGDCSLDLSAPLVVATLEAAWGASTHGLSADFWVVDEFQMLADVRRGFHYEAAIVSRPQATRFLFLSGSVANPEILAEWLGRLGKPCKVIKHSERPVPIEEVDAGELESSVPAHLGDKFQRIFAGAVARNLAPVLLFTPHRRDAERLAKKLAAIPLNKPLHLSQEQEAICSQDLRKLLEQRVAYHHSGMTYAQRAGIVEPLAKAGQLRFVVATLGLSAGVNFSLRSVFVARGSFLTSEGEREIAPHDFLQMVGRAGRRGLDEVGYYIAARQSLPLSYAKPLRLRRASGAPWSIMLGGLQENDDVRPQAYGFPARAFDAAELRSGLEQSFSVNYVKNIGASDAVCSRQHEKLDKPTQLPCGLLNDTARARLVRRVQAPYPACSSCLYRLQCEAMSPQPTPVWWWARLGLVDRAMRLTKRGWIASMFLGSEGLVIAALAEQENLDAHAAIFELADLFAADRFPSEEGRYGGMIARICQSMYGNVCVPGYLEHGIPLDYGTGGAEIVERFVYRERISKHNLQEQLAKGDRDRLVTEWMSLVRQLCNDKFSQIKSLEPLHSAALAVCELLPRLEDLPELPVLTAEQRSVFRHFVAR